MRRSPFTFFIDDACSTLVHLFCELGKYSRGEATKLESWVLFMLIALDICSDGFHIPNRKEFWCKNLLHPITRELPDNFNTQAGEQNFQEIVKYVGGLREMSRGRHRFMTISLYQIWSVQFSKTPVSERDTLTRNRERGDVKGKKHARREELRKQQLKPGAKTNKGERMVRGRFAVP